MADIDANIDALKKFREAVSRYWYEQRNVMDGADHEIEVTRASLEAKAERWRVRLEDRLAELERCRHKAAQAAAEGKYVDSSSWVRAVQEAEERMAHVRRWRDRVEEEVARSVERPTGSEISSKEIYAEPKATCATSSAAWRPLAESRPRRVTRP